MYLYRGSLQQAVGPRALGLLSLVAVACVARAAAALSARFLFPWDERYHALVARNTLRDGEWFLPKLRIDPVIACDYANWTDNHVWLHKSPLFLWQMAASMALFGDSLAAMRLPSIVSGTLLTFLTYFVAKRLAGARAALAAAALSACWGFGIAQAGGAGGMDHNGAAFVFYATVGLVAVVQWDFDPDKRVRWLVLLAFATGAGVLVKSFLGLVPLGFLGLVLLRRENWALRPWLFGALAGLAALAIAIPWNVFDYFAAPEEYIHEQLFVFRHISDAVEDHVGSAGYYFDREA